MRCFRDRQVRRKIREEGTKGDCPWCGATDVKVLPIGALTDMFRDVVRNYPNASSFATGERLDQLLDNDWQIFSDRLLAVDRRRRAELLLAILEHDFDPKNDMDEPSYHDLFASLPTSGVDLHGQWDDRLDAIIQGKLDLPESDDAGSNDGDGAGKLDAVTDAVESVGLVLRITGPLHRARIHQDRTRSRRLQPDEMGAPRPEDTKAARANRAHEPVLYMASNHETALAEVRAAEGDFVAVAERRLVRPLRILNLVAIRPIESPFGIEDLAWLAEAQGLLGRFGVELSRPIVPGEPDGAYLPSQHICDVAREAGYDGVAYPSAMGGGRKGGGYNVVLFDTTATAAGPVIYYRIEGPDRRAVLYTAEEIVFDA